jgi:hypothetical protein
MDTPALPPTEFSQSFASAYSHSAVTSSIRIAWSESEPRYIQLFSDLNKHNPIDLVPTLTIARERILDKHVAAPKEKQAVYDLAIKVLDGMIAGGEERTQALESLLKTAAHPIAALDTTRSMTSMNQLFPDAQTKRRKESLMRKKPALDTSFAQLRTAERQWNSQLPTNSRPETYRDIPVAVITVDADTRANPLEQKAYDQRSVYSWRTSYYNQYGYPRGYQR